MNQYNNRRYSSRLLQRTLKSLAEKEYVDEIAAQKQKNMLLDQWKLYENLASLMALLGLVFAILEYETNYVYPRDHYAEPLPTRILIFFTTTLSLIFLVIRRNYKYKWSKKVAEEIKQSKSQRIWVHPNFFRYTFFLEIIVTLIQPLPFYDKKIEITNSGVTFTFLLSEILYSLMYLRIFLIIRNALNMSLFSSSDAKKLCMTKYKFSANARFAIKCLTKKHPLAFAFCLLSITILLLAIELRIYERPYWSELEREEGIFENEDFGTFGTDIWVIIITMCTVGYGDFSPRTIGGRIICSTSALWGGVVTTVMIVVMTNLLSLSQEQTKAFYTLSLTKAAGKVIQRFMMYSRLKRNPHAQFRETQKAFHHLHSALRQFQLSKIQVNQLGFDIVSNEEKILHSIKYKISFIKSQIQYIIQYADQHGLLPDFNISMSLKSRYFPEERQNISSNLGVNKFRNKSTINFL